MTVLLWLTYVGERETKMGLIYQPSLFLLVIGFVIVDARFTFLSSLKKKLLHLLKKKYSKIDETF